MLIVQLLYIRLAEALQLHGYYHQEGTLMGYEEAWTPRHLGSWAPYPDFLITLGINM